MDDVVSELIRLLPEWQLAVIRFNDAVAERMDIASSDLQCLFVLDRGGSSTPGAIARRVGLTTGSASRMIDRLLAAGLVTRESDPADRRRAIVTIRPEASRRLHAIYDPLDESLRALLTGMSASALDEMRSFVERAMRATAADAGILRSTPTSHS